MTDPWLAWDALRTLSAGQREAWLRERFPDGAPQQWWRAVREDTETRLGPLRPASADGRAADFAVAVHLAVLAERTGGLSPARAGEWLLNLAVIALRHFFPPPPGLPVEVTPDGAVRFVLGALPLTREEALRAAGEERRRAAEEDEAARSRVPGRPLPRPARPTGTRAALLDVVWVVPSLAGVVGHVTDQDLADEARAWLAAVPLLDPEP
ncbi:hypothetical protein [Streptomyces sp. RFCAC02]|uniref:hypothetical protein n=1 Tax=Streptomyces sp. RFCAC02 TaxID=2499143 RepID=UPI0010211967|nr:hypothetical protein [Streptomyces sp. RFCAC02]